MKPPCPLTHLLAELVDSLIAVHFKFNIARALSAAYNRERDYYIEPAMYQGVLDMLNRQPIGDVDQDFSVAIWIIGEMDYWKILRETRQSDGLYPSNQIYVQ